MKVGDKARLVCPSDIAYGDQGRPPTIPGGATLVFEVELLEIKAPAAPAAAAPGAVAPRPAPPRQAKSHSDAEAVTMTFRDRRPLVRGRRSPEPVHMKIHEYQAKAILASYGVPVPSGKVAYTVAEAAEIAKELGLPVVVKAQIHAGGRGKGGGVKLASARRGRARSSPRRCWA